MYKCSGCIYKSTDLTSVRKHINKKNRCSDTELTILKLEVEFNCEFCNKKLATMDSLRKHTNICKIKLNQDMLKRANNEKEKRIKKLESKIKHLEQSSVKTINNTTNNMTNSNNNNTQINNYITISLTPYNDPNMQGMQQYLEAAIRKTFLSVPNLIESVHFNKEYPENHNICITNRRTKDAKVFDGKKWKTVNKDLLINEMVDTYEREITSYAEEKGKTKFIKEYESAKKRGNGEKDLKEEVHNVIYDNSDMVNTKIKEVQKPVIEDNDEKISVEQIEDESDSDSEDDIPLVDEYLEFQKKFNDGSDDDDEDDSE
jgi:hypothetical protein